MNNDFFFETNQLVSKVICEAKSKYKLMGSTGSLENLEKLIKQKMYWSKVKFEPVNDKEWSVYNSSGRRDNLRVVKKGGRFRLEIKLSESIEESDFERARVIRDYKNIVMKGIPHSAVTIDPKIPTEVLQAKIDAVKAKKKQAKLKTQLSKTKQKLFKVKDNKQDKSRDNEYKDDIEYLKKRRDQARKKVKMLKNKKQKSADKIKALKQQLKDLKSGE